ncbi:MULTISPECIES: Lrp/AsnC family transcriptional regulator [Streptomyces]|uniref:Lrp/AsnC family transcriptional regulator n=1 Tax=Streptomyces TaxID=1883 RepID=UPI0016718CCD|nr:MULTISPECIES: Lrp/AsnC family transcriptional regulator [Streptomyces]MBK3526057.1 Lrp/AsnC family transcriptional regulator [Streptomyces sp. MBT70]GGR75768.1 ArsR family transcriptional regulator [Streptomyces eurythermus]
MKTPSADAAALRDTPSPYVPDETDRRIIEHLVNNARQSARAIAREISMSPGAVSERISRLEAAGVILGYHADIDAAALGFGVDVLVGALVDQHSGIEQTVDALLEIEEVQTVYLTTGAWDLVIEVRVRDHPHLRDVMLGSIRAVPNLQRSEAMIILESHSGQTKA